jgi:hypothetical protein
VVAPAIVLLVSYDDIAASLVFTTLTDPVHVTVSFRDGDEVKVVGCVILAV